MVVDHTLVRKFEKTGLEWRDIFEEKNFLFKHWVDEKFAAHLNINRRTTSS